MIHELEQFEEVNINSIPGFEDVKYIKVDSPAFLDRALEAKAVRSKTNKPELLIDVFTLCRNDEAVYLYQCHKLPDGQYRVRFAYGARDIPDDLLITGASASLVKLDSSYKPKYSLSVEVDIMQFQDLVNVWGMEETVRHLGQRMVDLIEKRVPQSPERKAS